MLNTLAVASLILTALCFDAAAGGQTGIEAFNDRAAFTAASEGLKTVDFEGLVPNSGVKNYTMPGGLAAGGLTFRTSGGGRLGAGHVTVMGAWHNAGPIYETTTGAKLVWGPPNQPGDASLDVTLPSGVTAAGTDLWAARPAVSAVEVTVTTADGRSQAVTVNTAGEAAARSVAVPGIYTTASIAGSIKARDELTLEYKLEATDGARPGVANTAKAKAKSDGEDVLTPLVERAAEAIVAAAMKK